MFAYTVKHVFVTQSPACGFCHVRLRERQADAAGDEGEVGELVDPTKPFGAAELDVEGFGPEGEIVYNSTFFKKEYNKLKRIAQGPRAVEFPQITEAFNGTTAEQHDVIRRFVENGYKSSLLSRCMRWRGKVSVNS